MTSVLDKFRFLFRRSKWQEEAHLLYTTLVEQARLPVFYDQGGVPDSLDGRFDLISIHAFLVMRRLKSNNAEADALSQTLFNVMFGDMDGALREIGVSDLAVGKRIKDMVTAFYGRVDAYENALSQDAGAEGDQLCLALQRNLYRNMEHTSEQLAAVARYIRAEIDNLAGQSLADIMSGRVVYGAPPAADGWG